MHYRYTRTCHSKQTILHCMWLCLKRARPHTEMSKIVHLSGKDSDASEITKCEGLEFAEIHEKHRPYFIQKYY